MYKRINLKWEDVPFVIKYSWCGGGVFWGGLAQGEGTLECWTLGWDIPHQGGGGGARGAVGLDPKRRGGPYLNMLNGSCLLYVNPIVLAFKIINTKFAHSLTHILYSYPR